MHPFLPRILKAPVEKATLPLEVVPDVATASKAPFERFWDLGVVGRFSAVLVVDAIEKSFRDEMRRDKTNEEVHYSGGAFKFENGAT